MAPSSGCLHLLRTRDCATWRHLLWGNCATGCAVVRAGVRGEGRTRGDGVICRCAVVVASPMLDARVASFPRAAIDHHLHDDWRWGLLSAFCNPTSNVRDSFSHCDLSRQSFSEGFCSRSKQIPATCGVLSE